MFVLTVELRDNWSFQIPVYLFLFFFFYISIAVFCSVCYLAGAAVIKDWLFCKQVDAHLSHVTCLLFAE